MWKVILDIQEVNLDHEIYVVHYFKATIRIDFVGYVFHQKNPFNERAVRGMCVVKPIFMFFHTDTDKHTDYVDFADF